MQNIKTAIKKQVTELFKDVVDDSQSYRQRVFGLNKKYDNVDNCDFSDEKLAEIAVKFIVYDLLHNNNLWIADQRGNASWSGKILLSSQVSEEIEGSYNILRESDIVKTVRTNFTNDDHTKNKIKDEFTLDDIINEIRRTKPTLWEYIKHYAQVIWENIRDYSKEQVNHEETSLEKFKVQAESFKELREFVNDYESKMSTAIGGIGA